MAIPPRSRRDSLVVWADIDRRLRDMVRVTPMRIEELAGRLGVTRSTVKYHVLGRTRPGGKWGPRPGGGLHIFDDTVFAGTAAAWGHYA